MTDSTDLFHTTLRQHGQSLTACRRAVYEALQQAEQLSMQQVIAACAGTADRASIYRTVALFERLGIVQRLQVGWKYKLELAGAFSHHHHHLTCTVCGRVTPLPEDRVLEAHLVRLAASQDFEPQSHQLEISGRCRDCRSTAPSLQDGQL